MRDIVQELIVWGFFIVILVILLRDQQQANALLSGGVGTYTEGVSKLASLG